MSPARTSTLASLRGSIERIEAPGDAHALNKVALGHAGADATLQGGLAVAAVHEVFAEGRQGNCAQLCGIRAFRMQSESLLGALQSKPRIFFRLLPAYKRMKDLLQEER